MSNNKQNITNRDYDGFIQGLILAAKTDPTFKDYNFDGSGLRSIMRMLSLAGNQQAFSDNMMFNELSIKHGEMRENVGALASFLSYTPMSAKGATINVDITVTVPLGYSNPPSTLTLEPDNTFVGSKDGISYQFSPTQTMSSDLVGRVYEFKGVVLTQGRWVYNSFPASAMGPNTVESYVLPNKDIDITTLSVQVQASDTSSTYDEYTRYRRVYQLEPDAKVYFLELNKDNLYTLEFGDNKVAKQVVAPNIILTKALLTKGAGGNDINTILPTSPIGQFSNVTMKINSRSANGADAEDIRSISRNAPLAFGTDGVAVTASDYPSVLKELYPTAKITSWGGEENIPIMQGYTVLAVKPVGNTALTTAEKTAAVDYLSTRNVGSIFPVIVDADIYYINVETTIHWYPTKTTLASDAIVSLVTKDIQAYSTNGLENFKAEFDPKLISDSVRAHTMVKRDVTSVSYEKHQNIPANSDFTNNVDFHKRLSKGSLDIQGFQYKNVDARIDDVDGVLKLYTITTGVSTFIGDVGVIDYNTGMLSFQKFNTGMATDTNLVIKVKPDDIDVSVSSKRGEYIQIKNISVKTEVVL